MKKLTQYFFRAPAFSTQKTNQIIRSACDRLSLAIDGLATEWRYVVEVLNPLTEDKLARLAWILTETFEPDGFAERSLIDTAQTVLEVGPNLKFETAWSTTATEICHRSGLPEVVRIERFTRYGLLAHLFAPERASFLEPLFDRMTESCYDTPVESFIVGEVQHDNPEIPILTEGPEALARASKEFGWAMDDQDIEIYYNLFVHDLGRNPTKTEAGQLGGCNSDHSRHRVWTGIHKIDGIDKEKTLMQIAKEAWQENPGRTLSAFAGNCAYIEGTRYIEVLGPECPGKPGPMKLRRILFHISGKAESHNHPSAIEPFQGAGTGLGGLIRDIWAPDLGGLLIAGGAGYCVDNLMIPGYARSWEDGWRHPANLVSPLEGIIEMSNGASHYANCYGVPIIYGFAREFGMELPEGRVGWFKPVMYAIGSGVVDDRHITPKEPEKGMLVVKFGGPSYGIGIGGGSASSMNSGDNTAALDWASVQRIDPEMGNRDYRLIRACVEFGEDNPIVVLHDQGAVGNANVLTELLAKVGKFPGGGIINLRSLPMGDPSLSEYDTWLNESQEAMGVIIRVEDFERFEAIAKRENCPCFIVGQVTADGWVILFDELTGEDVVKLPLDKILGKLPQKCYVSTTISIKRDPLVLPEDLTVRQALESVFRLMSVGSKAYLTRKADRSVTAQVAAQQCRGPYHVPVGDYAAVAHSHFDTVGTGLSLGEQPIVGLISPAAGGRLSLSEALLQLVGLKITDIQDIAYSGNWMWPAKQPGEAAKIFETAEAIRDLSIALGIHQNTGKDSASMTAKNVIAPDGSLQTVNAPGQVIIGSYVTVEDVSRQVSPAMDADNLLFHIDISRGKRRLGGSALAQCHKQVGNECPDVDDEVLLSWAFKVLQEMLDRGIITAVHDVSDGGLITTVLEMAFAGNVGVKLDVDTEYTAIEELFAQEPGLVFACEPGFKQEVEKVLRSYNLAVRRIGESTKANCIMVIVNDEIVLMERMTTLHALWEETSSKLDALQTNPDCVEQEFAFIKSPKTDPQYRLTYEPTLPWGRDGSMHEYLSGLAIRPKVAILREQGSNGDREMTAAFLMAGFEPWDVNMSDLIEGKMTLDIFQGLVFVGGFSFGDVLDSAKGWAAGIKFNENVAAQFAKFYNRPETFSLGVCNGCQLMALLGWIPWLGIEDKLQPRFIRNESERFESRFPIIKINDSPAIMFEGMAGSVLGVWVSHGEGRLHVPDSSMLVDICERGLAPMIFTDFNGDPTEMYPLNPNGSPGGVTALVSPDGRHLAMMPHPERTFQLWHWPWLPKSWRNFEASPWLRMFQNAYNWAIRQ